MGELTLYAEGITTGETSITATLSKTGSDAAWGFDRVALTVFDMPTLDLTISSTIPGAGDADTGYGLVNRDDDNGNNADDLADTERPIAGENDLLQLDVDARLSELVSECETYFAELCLPSTDGVVVWNTSDKDGNPVSSTNGKRLIPFNSEGIAEETYWVEGLEAGETTFTLQLFVDGQDDPWGIQDEATAVFLDYDPDGGNPVLDLDIFMPAVLDPAMREIEEDREYDDEAYGYLGSVTFVNLDNDNADGVFDIEGETIGDDELVKLRLMVGDPSGESSRPSYNDLLRLGVYPADSVKIWKTHEKTAGTEYEPETWINVSDDSFDWTHDEPFGGGQSSHYCTLWVEGIDVPDNDMAGFVRFTLEFGPEEDEDGNPQEPFCTDEVALSVLGIKDVKWELIGEGAKLKDEDWNWPADIAGVDHMAVYPDSLPNDSPNAPLRNRIEVSVTMTGVSAVPFTIPIKWFDVDDPTAHNNAVDDESTPDDNYDSYNVCGFGGNDVHELEFPAYTTGPYTDLDHEARFQKTVFTLSWNPGDNFRVVANPDSDFLAQLENDDTVLHQNGNESKQYVIDPHVYAATGDASAAQVLEANSYVSPTLTIWRKLNLQLDKMERATYNQIRREGLVTGIKTDDQGRWTEVTVNQNLDDASKNLDDSSGGFHPFKGQFENGCLAFTSPEYFIEIDPIIGNGDDSVRFDARNITGLTFVGRDGDDRHAEGAVVSIVEDNGSYLWTLDVDEGDSDSGFEWDGDIQIAEGGWIPMQAWNPAAGTLRTSALSIPFHLYDDDFRRIDYLPFPTLSIAQTFPGRDYPADLHPYIAEAFWQVYIVPQDPVSHSIPFERDYSIAQAKQLFADTNVGQRVKSEAYWVAHAALVSEIDHGIKELGDKDSLYDPDAHVGYSGSSAVVAVETIADFMCRYPAAMPDDVYQNISAGILHEIGHQFGLDHGGPYIMGPYPTEDLQSSAYTPIYKKMLPMGKGWFRFSDEDAAAIRKRQIDPSDGDWNYARTVDDPTAEPSSASPYLGTEVSHNQPNVEPSVGASTVDVTMYTETPPESTEAIVLACMPNNDSASFMAEGLDRVGLPLGSLWEPPATVLVMPTPSETAQAQTKTVSWYLGHDSSRSDLMAAIEPGDRLVTRFTLLGEREQDSWLRMVTQSVTPLRSPMPDPLPFKRDIPAAKLAMISADLPKTEVNLTSHVAYAHRGAVDGIDEDVSGPNHYGLSTLVGVWLYSGTNDDRIETSTRPSRHKKTLRARAH